MQNHLLFRKPNAGIAALSFASLFLFTGCGLSNVTAVACDVSGKDPHCSQEAAVQSDNADNCDSVAQKEEFKKLGSNPPRDKCVVMVAANTEDPSACDKVKGGLLSYGKEDCTKAIADTATDPTTCTKLAGDAAACANKVAEKTYKDIETVKNMKQKDERDIQQLQKTMNDLQKMNEMLTNVNKAAQEMQMTAVRGLRG